jgi:hypothetical protein
LSTLHCVVDATGGCQNRGAVKEQAETIAHGLGAHGPEKATGPWGCGRAAVDPQSPLGHLLLRLLLCSEHGQHSAIERLANSVRYNAAGSQW